MWHSIEEKPASRIFVPLIPPDFALERMKGPRAISIIPAKRANFEQKLAGGTLLWTPGWEKFSQR
jgi:hypothetical protein